MYRIVIKYISSAIASIAIATVAPNSFAKITENSSTIFESSIKWEDQIDRSKLLETAPKWHDDVIKLLFEAYRHPERYQLNNFPDANQYNIQFINAFWGPLNNPFTKYARPAKAFIFLSKTSEPEISYMVPLIKNLADGNYYIFDKIQTRPVLLNDWVANIRNTHDQPIVRFNVCNGYGNLPTDTCSTKNYKLDVLPIESRFLRTAVEPNPSAYRDMNEDWKTTVNKISLLKAEPEQSIYETSRSWADVIARTRLLNTVASWSNYKVIKDNFEKIRDLRYINDEKYPDFSRRISWLYPDDGCWTRATAVIKDLFGPFKNAVNQYPRPSKVFAFGKLCANTSNSKTGKVTWWYHTAPIVRDAATNQTYVLDPSVNPYGPTETEKWMTAISSNSGACSQSKSEVSLFNICNGYGVIPYDICQDEKINFAKEIHSMLTQYRYQAYERARQIELGRDADKVLGDLPPWLEA